MARPGLRKEPFLSAAPDEVRDLPADDFRRKDVGYVRGKRLRFQVMRQEPAGPTDFRAGSLVVLRIGQESQEDVIEECGGTAERRSHSPGNPRQGALHERFAGQRRAVDRLKHGGTAES